MRSCQNSILLAGRLALALCAHQPGRQDASPAVTTERRGSFFSNSTISFLFFLQKESSDFTSKLVVYQNHGRRRAVTLGDPRRPKE